MYWWSVDVYIENKCKFDTLEECEKAVQYYKKLKSKPDEPDISHKTIKWFW